VYRWRWWAGQQPERLPNPKRTKDTRIILSRDGELIATLAGKRVTLWDTATGKETHRLEAETELDEGEFSADGTKFAALGRHRAVILWDVKTGIIRRAVPKLPAKVAEGRSLQRPFDFDEEVSTFGLSPDGKILVAAFFGSHIPLRFWDTATGKELRTVKRSDDSLRRIVFSPDGRLIALASQHGLRLLQASTGKELWHLPVFGNQLIRIAFSPDGRTLAGALVFTVKLWDVATGREIAPVPEHRDGVGFIQLSPDGTTVTTSGQATGGIPGSGGPSENAPSLRYWQAKTGMQLVPSPSQDRRFPPLAGLSADGKTLASWSKDSCVQFWDVPTGKPVRKVPYKGEAVVCNLSPDGKLLLLGSREEKASVVEGDVKLQLWDVASGKPLGRFKGHRGSVWFGRFSPDGKILATIGYTDRTIRLWDVKAQKELHKLAVPERWIWVVAFSADGRALAGAGITAEVRAWDVATGKEKSTLATGQIKRKHESGVYALLFTPDGKTLIASDNNGKVFFWDAATGALRLEWKAHQFRVSYLAISADGKVLLTQGATTALVWDVSELLKPTVGTIRRP
jgi:WD40 repeat protein